MSEKSVVHTRPFTPMVHGEVASCGNRLREATESVGLGMVSIIWFAEKHLVNCYCKSIPDSPTSSKSCNVFKSIITHLWAVPTLVIGIPLYLIGNALLLARQCSSTNLRYSKGNHREVAPHQIEAFHLNACSLPGSMPLHFGGLSINNSRIDKQIELFKNKGMVFLSEVSPQTSRYIMGKTKNHFAHFFFDMGLKSFCLDSGLFFATKYQIEEPVFVPFRNLGKCFHNTFKRGFLVVRCKKCTFYFTHLHPKSKRERLYQLLQIKLHMAREIGEVYLIGDLNIDSYKSILEHKKLKDLGFEEIYPKSKPTCIASLKLESIDYVLRLNNNDKVSTAAVTPIDTWGNGWAISDHKAVVLKV